MHHRVCCISPLFVNIMRRVQNVQNQHLVFDFVGTCFTKVQSPKERPHQISSEVAYQGLLSPPLLIGFIASVHSMFMSLSNQQLWPSILELYYNLLMLAALITLYTGYTL